jgi:hypothetical protein
MRLVDSPHLDQSSFDSTKNTSARPTSAGSVLSYVSVSFGVFLVALVAWFTFYLAGATIDSGSFYTGPVGAVFGAFLAIGVLLSLGSTVSALGVRMRASKGSVERARAWLVWIAANAFFVVGVIAASVIVNIKVG